jgi:hypothetical protein
MSVTSLTVDNLRCLNSGVGIALSLEGRVHRFDSTMPAVIEPFAPGSRGLKAFALSFGDWKLVSADSIMDCELHANPAAEKIKMVGTAGVRRNARRMPG